MRLLQSQQTRLLQRKPIWQSRKNEPLRRSRRKVHVWVLVRYYSNLENGETFQDYWVRSRKLTITYRPYAKPPVEILIGPKKIVHYVPRRLLPLEWSKADSEIQWYLPSLTMDTGHTLANYLHTRAYETMDTH
jgi:hypothetical protein